MTDIPQYQAGENNPSGGLGQITPQAQGLHFVLHPYDTEYFGRAVTLYDGETVLGSNFVKYPARRPGGNFAPTRMQLEMARLQAAAEGAKND